MQLGEVKVKLAGGRHKIINRQKEENRAERAVAPRNTQHLVLGKKRKKIVFASG